LLVAVKHLEEDPDSCLRLDVVHAAFLRIGNFTSGLLSSRVHCHLRFFDFRIVGPGVKMYLELYGLLYAIDCVFRRSMENSLCGNIRVEGPLSFYLVSLGILSTGVLVSSHLHKGFSQFLVSTEGSFWAILISKCGGSISLQLFFVIYWHIEGHVIGVNPSSEIGL